MNRKSVLMISMTTVWLAVLGGVDDWLKLTVRTRGGTRDGLKMWEKLLFQIGLGVLLGIFVYRFGSAMSTVHAPYLQEKSAVGTGSADDATSEPQKARPAEIESFRILTVPFYKHSIMLGLPAFLIVTVLVVAGTSNAVNLTDGMDGLASGCMALCSFVFMILSALQGGEGHGDIVEQRRHALGGALLGLERLPGDGLLLR